MWAKVLILFLAFHTYAGARGGGSGSVVGNGGNGLEAKARSLLKGVILEWDSLGVPEIQGLRTQELLAGLAPGRLSIEVGQAVAKNWEGQTRDAVNLCGRSSRIYINESAWNRRNEEEQKHLVTHEFLGTLGLCARDQNYELSSLLVEGPEKLRKAAFSIREYRKSIGEGSWIRADFEGACQFGLSAAKEFLDLGGSVDTKVEDLELLLDGPVPLLYFAVYHQCPAYTQFLIQHDANVNAQTLKGRVTPLFTAVSQLSLTRFAPLVVKILLDAGANPNFLSRASSGGIYSELATTPLWTAERLYATSLAESGPSSPLHEEALALGASARYAPYYQEIIKLLKARGAEIRSVRIKSKQIGLPSR